MLILSSLPSIAVAIFMIVAYWKLFKKAGEEGWKCLIPIYSNYLLFKIAQKKNLFWWSLLCETLLGVAYTFITVSYFALARISSTVVMSNEPELFFIIGLFLFALSAIGLIVIRIKHALALAESFGQTTAFGVGLLLLEPIFVGILAFDYNMIYKAEADW